MNFINIPEMNFKKDKEFMDCVEQKIKIIMSRYFETYIVYEKTDFNCPLNDFGIDSLTFIKIIVEIETEFDFEFEDEDLDVNKYSSLQSLVSYVVSKLINT